MGWIGCVRCEKFRRDFVARTFALVRTVLHEFCKATKQSRMLPNHTNAPKRQFRVRWGVSGAFVAKNSDATSWHELLHKFGRFAPSFVRQPNGPECTQMVRNAPKRHFRVKRGGSGAFVAKNLDATSLHEVLH